MKLDQNTELQNLDRVNFPNTSTCIDRYFFANTWTKNKTVLDAATGKGYGAGILLSLGAKKVVGVDIDTDGIIEANKRMASENCKYYECDIFDLKSKFSENEFDVCTSIETFEHLPTDRINEYLQGIRHVTRETIVITTPRRKTETWSYDGGTHLYEYDIHEFCNILKSNFSGGDVILFGLDEIELPNKQWGTDISFNVENCWIFVAVITLNK